MANIPANRQIVANACFPQHSVLYILFHLVLLILDFSEQHVGHKNHKKGHAEN